MERVGTENLKKKKKNPSAEFSELDK